MALSDIVNIVVQKSAPGITAQGFGIPLIPSFTASWVERTRTYNGETQLAGDWADTTVEYQAGSAMFAQSPSIPTVMIGRCVNKPQQQHTISIATVVSTAGTPYKVRLNNLSTGAAGAGIGQFATFTTVGSDTNDTIIAGLKTAIDALAITGLTTAITGSVGSHVLTLTMATGDWLGVELFDVSQGTVGGLMNLQETTADPGITADLNALIAASKAWYGLVMTHKSSALVLAAAAVVESNTKLFIMSTADTLAATQANGTGSDILQSLASANRARTGPAFHPRNDEFFDACEVGRWFSIDPGKDNWTMKPLSGPTPFAIIGTQDTNLRAKHANWYESLNGQVNAVQGDGMVSDGEYIDSIRFIDWWTANLQADLVNVELQNEKVPYEDVGVALFESAVRKRNKLGVTAGGINGSTVTYAIVQVADESSTNKQTRYYDGLQTSWELAGAINKLKVTATITQ